MPKKAAPKRPRRTAIVPRVVFSVAVGASVIPSLVGCGPTREPETRQAAPPPSSWMGVAVPIHPIPTPTGPPPTSLVPSVAVTPPQATVAPESGIDAGVAEPEAAPPRRHRSRRPPPTLLGVAAVPDSILYGVAVSAD